MEWNYFKYSIVKGVEDGDNSVSNTYMLIIPQLHIHTTSYTTSIAQSASSSSQIKYNYNQLVLLETILTQICNLFEYGQLEYFLKLYDWNFMEEDICLNSIKYLY
jgi:hypothetical protein